MKKDSGDMIVKLFGAKNEIKLPSLKKFVFKRSGCYWKINNVRLVLPFTHSSAFLYTLASPTIFILFVVAKSVNFPAGAMQTATTTTTVFHSDGRCVSTLNTRGKKKTVWHRNESRMYEKKREYVSECTHILKSLKATNFSALIQNQGDCWNSFLGKYCWKWNIFIKIDLIFL